MPQRFTPGASSPGPPPTHAKVQDRETSASIPHQAPQAMAPDLIVLVGALSCAAVIGLAAEVNALGDLR